MGRRNGRNHTSRGTAEAYRISGQYARIYSQTNQETGEGRGMKTYFIECLEGTGFCSWSYENPPNRKQIIEHFNDLRETEQMEFSKKCLTLKFIADFWGVEIKPNGGKNDTTRN